MTVCTIEILGCAGAAGNETYLAQLLDTNVPCRVRLQPAWVGYTEPTIRTGTFTNSFTPELDQLQRELRFDWFHYSNKPSNFNFGSTTISKSEGEGVSSIHTLRSSLPADAALNTATTLSELEKLLGPSQGGRCIYGMNRVMHSSAGWAFFRLKDAETIETMTISCGITLREPEPEWHVDSIMVRRGTAKPKLN